MLKRLPALIVPLVLWKPGSKIPKLEISKGQMSSTRQGEEILSTDLNNNWQSSVLFGMIRGDNLQLA
jgi:hypothetical protein